MYIVQYTNMDDIELLINKYIIQTYNYKHIILPKAKGSQTFLSRLSDNSEYTTNSTMQLQ